MPLQVRRRQPRHRKRPTIFRTWALTYTLKLCKVNLWPVGRVQPTKLCLFVPVPHSHQTHANLPSKHQRQTLPIAAHRDQILQILSSHQVLVLSGETGCGKSTQLPAFILEDQLSRGLPCKIFCTEPRRISAISLAQRVSAEQGESPNAVETSSGLVGYSVRLDSHIGTKTRLAYVTYGIALKMLENGSVGGRVGTAFDEVTHVIIDEVCVS